MKIKVITEKELNYISLELSKYTASPYITKREFNAMLGYNVKESERSSYRYWLEENSGIAYKLMVFRHYLYFLGEIIYEDQNHNKTLIKKNIENKDLKELCF